MAKNVTMADIAERVGVSKVAVSKALSGKTGVSEELRNRIKQVAMELGYEMGKGASVKTGNIGVIVPEYFYGYTVSFYRQMYECVVKSLYHHKLFGILELLTRENEKACTVPKVILDNKVDGLILLGQMDPNYVKAIIDVVEVPILFLDAYYPDIKIDTVLSDGFHGTYELTNALVKLGHQRIVFVGNPEATSSIADRYWGYRRAIRENKIQFEEWMEIHDRDCGGINYRINLDLEKDVDAYVCNSDFTAYLLIEELKKRGISVPKDVSVVGFDDFLPFGMDEYDITSYRVDLECMAENCVVSLMNKIKGVKYVEGIQVVTGQYVLKDTVRKRTKKES